MNVVSAAGFEPAIPALPTPIDSGLVLGSLPGLMRLSFRHALKIEPRFMGLTGPRTLLLRSGCGRAGWDTMDSYALRHLLLGEIGPPALFFVQPGWGRGRAKQCFMRLRTPDTCAWSNSWTSAGPPGATGAQPIRDAVMQGLGPVLGRLSPGLGAEGATGLDSAGP